MECFEVFGRGYWYGTLRSEVTPSLTAGKWVVLEIDVDGTLAVLGSFPHAVTIFVRPTPSRSQSGGCVFGTESESAIGRRLEVARRELGLSDRYRYVDRDETVVRRSRIVQIPNSLEVCG